MTLLSHEISRKCFSKTLRGFSQKEVHIFLENLAQEMHALSCENQTLKQELQKLHRDMESFEKRENMLKDTLMTAQQAVDEIRTQAKKEASLIVAESALQADKLISSAEDKASKILEEIYDLRQQKMRLIQELRAVLQMHAKMLGVHEDTSQALVEEDDASLTVLPRVRAPLPTGAASLG